MLFLYINFQKGEGRVIFIDSLIPQIFFKETLPLFDWIVSLSTFLISSGLKHLVLLL